MQNSIFTDVVNVLRRPASSQSARDVLGNPTWGSPLNWPAVYSNTNVRIQFSGKEMVFAATGEIIRPAGVVYYPPSITIQPQDRIVTVSCPGYPAGVEYLVKSVIAAFVGQGLVDHYEAQIAIPIA